MARIIRCSYLEKSPNLALPSTTPLASTHRQHTVTEGQLKTWVTCSSHCRGTSPQDQEPRGTLKEKQAATQPSRKAVFRLRQSANNRFKLYHGLQLSESFQILPLNTETFFLPL